MCDVERNVQKLKCSRLKGGEKKRDGCFALLNMTEDSWCREDCSKESVKCEV